MRAHAASPWRRSFLALPLVRSKPRDVCAVVWCADLCSSVVVSPEGSDLVLSSYVPYVELYVAVGDRLDVEPDRWDGRHRLVQLQLVQDRYKSKADQDSVSDGQLVGGGVRIAYTGRAGAASGRRGRGEEEGGPGQTCDSLVFPAASSPSMRIRISLLPKILPETSQSTKKRASGRKKDGRRSARLREHKGAIRDSKSRPCPLVLARARPI